MVPRMGSPALSENGFDITKSLFAEGASDDSDSELDAAVPKGARGKHAEDIMPDDGEESSGDEAFIAAQQAASNRKASNLKGKTVKKGGGFQAMGLDGGILKAITRKGFSVPTPIQRKAIPVVMDGQDVVGMARTGSGKTAAFVIPMIQKLKAHSARVGARAAIVSPSRELALQTLKVVKELGRGTDLRTVLLVGGDSLEEQFSSMASNPDIIIATPGRFLHLKVEMNLDLSSIRYMVFDEADRLFEMGFAAQLSEILHALPPSRQTLLFSATLPKSLVEFARAGLQDPALIRLDAESKISPDLQSAFFTVKSSEKEGALLCILQNVIQMPTGPTEASVKAKKDKAEGNKKRKRETDEPKSTDSPTKHSTIVFAATKHHVEYLTNMLQAAGYAVSHVYGSLDQTARKSQVEQFRRGYSNILVVTDVAARGIDMPILANVINYDFPSQPKIYVHRVGRTARAGSKGWSYSLVRDGDMPYLLDLQLFLGRKLVLGRSFSTKPSFAEDIVVGSLEREKLGVSCEEQLKLLDADEDLVGLRTVATKGEKLYLRTRNSASRESAKRAREILSERPASELNALFSEEASVMQDAREKMLARVGGFRPSETIFEIGKRGSGSEAAEVMRQRRSKIEPRRQKPAEIGPTPVVDESPEQNLPMPEANTANDFQVEDDDIEVDFGQDEDDNDGLDITMSNHDGSNGKATKDSWQDPEHFISYTPKSLNLVEDRAYGVHSGSYNPQGPDTNFVDAARGAAMDLANDETSGFQAASKSRGLRWDKKSKKYVSRANDEDGSKGAKMVRGESGQKIAASFRSGRFDAWKKSNRIGRLPRTGETESSKYAGKQNPTTNYKHKGEKAPKRADKYRDDFHKQQKKVDEAKEKRIGSFKQGPGKSEIKGVNDVRKARNLQQKRKDKNARPSKKNKKV